MKANSMKAMREGDAKAIRKRRKDMKREVEYAIQVRTRDGYEDYSLYNRRTCLWKKPIEDWAADIITGYEYKRCCEKHRSTRLVKRVTTEEIICKRGEAEVGKGCAGRGVGGGAERRK